MNRIAPPTGPRPVPEDVRTATQLWWAALAVGVVQVIAAMLAEFGQRKVLAAELLDQLRDDQPTLARAEVMVMMTMVVGTVLILSLLGAAAFAAFQLQRGKRWARTLLMVLAVFLVVGAAGVLFSAGDAAPGALPGSGGVGGIAGLVAGGASVVQAVLAAGAVFLCYRAESDAYFRPGPR
ncbi:hypothetical protein [Nocardia sp. CC201C]|uniref:hypothetical protein n=1 Tax=Nocardia sp. CC201C TaxID=3044575 RepID=UPI0024A9E110|nr:hypothetical protein [Nocardia sp. CC201C]